jgi:type VI secretion system secreted protein VgrG
MKEVLKDAGKALVETAASDLVSQVQPTLPSGLLDDGLRRAGSIADASSIPAGIAGHIGGKGGASLYRALEPQTLSGTVAGAFAAAGRAGTAPGAVAKAIAGADSRTVTVRSAAMPQLLGEPALRFFKLEGGEHLSKLFDYTLELRTADDTAVPLAVSANIDVSVLIGKDMTVEVELDGSGTGLLGGVGAGVREISGMVVSAGFSRREGHFHVFSVRLRPWLWLATLTTDFKIFQDKSVLEIIDAVLADYPYPVEKRLEAAKYAAAGESMRNEPRAFQVQYGETDFDFIQRLTEEWGIYWFFEHSDGKHRLVLCDHVGAHKSSPSEAYATVEYRPQDSRIDREFLRVFTLSEGLRPGSVRMADFDFTRPITDLSSISQQPLPHSPRLAEVYLWPGDYTDSKHADLMSRVRMEELRSTGARAIGAGNVRGFACGQTFVLDGHTHDHANQEYLLIEAKLRLTDIGEESGSGQRYECECQILVQPATEVFRPPRETSKPRTNGPQSAIVVGPKGEEIWTDEFGRVKVRFLWDRYAYNDETASCWVRVNQAWAGSGFGGIFIPRIDQEVVVDFMNGDPDRPLIIGGLYNTQTRPPWALPANATQSGFMSRSMKGGPNNFNGMRFEDKQGGEHFLMQAEKDLGTTVKNNENRDVGADRTTSIVGNETLKVKGTRTETITGDETEIFDSNRKKTIKFDEETKIGANRTETVEGDHTETITGTKKVTVKVDQTEKILGNREETVSKEKEETVTLGKTTTVGVFFNTKINGTKKTEVTGAHVESAASRLSTIDADHTMIVGGTQNVAMSGDQFVTATNIVISATTSLKLLCGGASISMDAGGNIVISGTSVDSSASGVHTINGASVSSSASGLNKVEGMIVLLNP